METDKGFFYIAVSLGIIDYEKKKIFLISPESPLAQAMNGKTENEVFSMNETQQKIVKIW